MRSDRLTTILVAALVLVLVGGGTTAYLVGRNRSTAAADPTPAVTRPAVTTTVITTASVGAPPPDSTDNAGPSAGGSTPAPPTSPAPPTGSPPASAVPEPSAPSTGSTESPAPASTDGDPATSTAPTATTAVAIAGVAADHPMAEDIRELLQRYFDSINDRDYQLWVSAVTPDLSDELPERQWLSEYGSTRDTDINVIRIYGDPVKVDITFRSRQDPKNAPDNKSTCLNWKITHPLTPSPDGLRIKRSVESAADFQPCSAG